MLWRRDLLEAGGGIEALGAEIAEDAAATKLVHRAGLRAHLVGRPFQQPLGIARLRDVWERQVRWARLRRATFPLYFAPELLTTSLFTLLAAAIAAPEFGLDAPLAVLLAALSGTAPKRRWRASRAGRSGGRRRRLVRARPVAAVAVDPGLERRAVRLARQRDVGRRRGPGDRRAGAVPAGLTPYLKARSLIAPAARERAFKRPPARDNRCSPSRPRRRASRGRAAPGRPEAQALDEIGIGDERPAEGDEVGAPLGQRFDREFAGVAVVGDIGAGEGAAQRGIVEGREVGSPCVAPSTMWI